MWLTFATFVGYAVIYTMLLKPLTPQNIVIGGASGAMPPVLGWAAIRGDVGAEALILCLIIFLWTPPHFWALALYRAEDYRERRPADAAGHARLRVHAAARLPLHARAVRGDPAAVRRRHERRRSIWRRRSCSAPMFMRLRLAALAPLLRRAGAKTFRFSIIYLSLLFAALLVDHYLGRWL